MLEKRKIKLYTQYGKYLHLKSKMDGRHLKFLARLLSVFFNCFYYIGLGLINAIIFLKNLCIFISFQTGIAVFKSIEHAVIGLKNEIAQTGVTLSKRFALIFTSGFTRTLLVFLLSLGLVWGVLSSLNLTARALQIKNKITRTAFWGERYLNQAKDLIEQKDFTQAQNRFELAYRMFSRGQANIAESGKALNSLLDLIPQKADADKLLKAASLIAKSGESLISIQGQFNHLKFGPAGIFSEDGKVTEILDSSGRQLKQSLKFVEQAQDLVDATDSKNIPPEAKEKYENLKSKLLVGSLALKNFILVYDLAQSLIMDNQTVLLVFENNNELRAGGGFMGTYGLLKMRDGALTHITVSSIYDLDGQLTETLRPPHPLLNVSGKWFMRDSNWFADFPTSAKIINSFYEKEGGQTPDLVVALTPNIIADWLKIVGPVTLPKYGITLNSENFVEQTQVAATLSENMPTNQPKQILADLVPILLQKISSLDANAFIQVIQSLESNLNSKQIVIFSRNLNTQKKLTDFHWTGEIATTDRDYLALVSSNLGGTKTDLAVDQNVKLTTTIRPDGVISNQLEITRTNKLPKLEKTNNLSFIRVFVPLGSKLISNIGFDFKNLEYPSAVNYKTDDNVLDWEKNSVQDVLTGTTIGTETGKTFFGNWLNLEGGETKTVKLTYELPFKLDEIDRYSLLVQKQIGALDSNFSWNLNFSTRQIAWKNFDTESLDTSRLSSNTILSKDYFLGLVLQKR